MQQFELGIILLISTPLVAAIAVMFLLKRR